MADILVVDDLIDITETLKTLLEEDGHKVDTASTPSKAKELLAEHQYDVMMTDILMPEESGISLIHDVNTYTDRYKKPSKIIAMSGGGPTMEPDVALGAAAYKADFQMKKPFTKEKLQFVLQVVLNQECKTGT